MSFLTPWSALVAAAIAVPLLVLLYFLKLRRQALRIASTILWRTATEDLQANVPFQRLRWSLLLLLQLLLVTLLIAALARPVVQTGRGTASRMILLIDRSASMNAPAGGVAGPGPTGGSRLDAARDAARETVELWHMVLFYVVRHIPGIECSEMFQHRRLHIIRVIRYGDGCREHADHQ